VGQFTEEELGQALNPEVRRATNTGRRKDASAFSRPAGFAGYSARKPYVVAERLDDLCGPTGGTVNLARHLDWSGNATYDLDKPARLASMYRTVLNAAGSTDDLRTWIDGRLLVQLWSALWLPAQLRTLWESRFPELTALGAEA
jgi:hypothetical protein